MPDIRQLFLASSQAQRSAPEESSAASASATAEERPPHTDHVIRSEPIAAASSPMSCGRQIKLSIRNICCEQDNGKLRPVWPSRLQTRSHSVQLALVILPSGMSQNLYQHTAVLTPSRPTSAYQHHFRQLVCKFVSQKYSIMSHQPSYCAWRRLIAFPGITHQ